MSDMPKIIWMLWLQGFEDAPTVVKKCYESWKIKNPEWEIRFLDKSDYLQTADLTHIFSEEALSSIPTPALSDIIRINLLAKYGGVWVDATCFCCQPLDNWIQESTKTGFFAFLGHRNDTIISSWFLASHLNSYITKALRDEVNSYWTNNPITKTKPKTYTILKKICNRNTKSTLLWFSPPVKDWLKIKPYFWFHYIFALLIFNDKKFAATWEKTIKLDADTPHKLQYAGLLSPPDEHIKFDIDNQVDKVYKLNWKLHKLDPSCNANRFPDNSTIAYALNSTKYFDKDN